MSRNYSYESLADAADAAEKRHTGYHSDSGNVGDPDDSWAFGVSFSQALEMARHGWHDQLEDTLAIAESAVQMADQEHMVDTFDPVWDVTGAEVDVARYLSGEPENMIDFPLSRTSKVGRVVTIVVSTEWSAVVSADAIFRRGQLIVALAMALTRLGHSVEMYANAHGAHHRDGSCEISVKVKGVDDEIDPAAIMFAYAHPAMLRRLVFGVREGGCTQQHMPAKPTASLYPEGAIVMPELKSGRDMPDADQFLRQYLGELGLLAG